MTNEKPEHTPSPESVYNAAGSLGYGQGTEFQYIATTQSITIKRNPHQKRAQQLLAQREQQFIAAQSGLLKRGFHKMRAAVQRINTSSTSIGMATMMITISMIASRFLGLMRSSMFMGIFPGTALSDAYTQAFLVPDLIFNIVTGGALASAFIPVFNLYMVEKEDEKTAWHLASSTLNIAMLGMMVLALFGIIFADEIILPYTYGTPPKQLALTASLTRIMFLQSIILGGGVIITSILNARRHFLLPALGSVLYPVGLILGLLPGYIPVIFHHPINEQFAIYSAAWGVVVGALLMVGVQLPALKKVGLQYRCSFDWQHPGLRQIMRQMIPRMFNAVMLNMSNGVDRTLILLLVVIVGSKAIDGLITLYTLSFGVVLIPLSFVMALSTASFPTMTLLAAEGRLDRLRDMILEAMRSVLFIVVPTSVGLMLLSVPVVQVLYEHNSFTFNKVQLTVIPLICFALGLPGLALVEILTRSFYALRHSKTPVIVSVGQFVVKIALSLLLVDPAVWLVRTGVGALFHSTLSQPLLAGAWAMGALALATSLAVLLEAFILLWLLHKEVGGLRLRQLLPFLRRISLSTLAMAGTLLVSHWLLDSLLITDTTGNHSLTMQGVALVIVKLLTLISIGSFTYLRTARFLRVLGTEELGPVNRLLTRLRLSWI